MFLAVCVYLLVCLQNNSNSYGRILVNCLGNVAKLSYAKRKGGGHN